MIYTGPKKKHPLLRKANGKKVAFDKDGKVVDAGSEEAVITVAIPPQPPKSKVYGYGRPVIEQKWKRTEVPKDLPKWEAEEMKAETDGIVGVINKEYEAYKRQEWDRRINGFWFMLKGKPTYITGKHYFYLQACKLDRGYPDYYDELRYHFYFVEACLEDPYCFGYMWLGGRGIGKSSVECGILLEESSRPPRNSSFAIQSKTEDDAKSLLVKKLVPMFNKLPKKFKPVFDNTSNTQSVLSFHRIARRGAEARFVTYEDHEELANTISFFDSKVIALDSQTMRWILEDEIGKTDPTRGNVYKRNEVNRPCVDRNVGKIGMMAKTSTVEEMEEGGAECKALYKDSDQSKRNPETKTTVSGVFRKFVSIIESDSRFRDEYGVVDQKACKKYHDAERKQRENNPAALASYIRKFPYYVEEAFYTSSSKCQFNVLILQNALAKLINNDHSVRGDLVWKNGVEMGEVVWLPNPKGKYKATGWLPKKEECNKVAKRHRRGRDEYLPLNGHKFALGADPIDYKSSNSEHRRSKPVTLGKRKFDVTVDPIDLTIEESANYEYKTNRYFLMYDVRPDDPNEYFKDMVKMAFFLGCPIHVERNKPGLINHFNRVGMAAFILNRPDETKPGTKQKKNSHEQGTPAQAQVIHQYTEMIAAYVAAFGHTIEFPELLEDLLEFDPNKTTDYDYAVAMGFCEMACLSNNKSRTSRTDVTIGEMLMGYTQR